MLTFMPAPGDRTDRAILSTLQRDGRIANVDLAEAVSLSPSACLRRVKALEASGIIEGYRAEISRTRAGLGLTAFIGLKVDGHSRSTSLDVERALMAIPAVVACYVVTGSDDFMVEVATQDLAAYPGGKDFLAAYKAKYGTANPDPYAIYGYEAMKLGLDTIKQLGAKGDNKADVLKALFAIKARPSVLGTYGFNKNGDTTLKSYGLYKVGSDGEPVFVKTLTPTQTVG